MTKVKKLTELRRIESWIYTHGRPLEAACYNIVFKAAPMEPFLDLLSRYQNDDGGFGRALEPDSWNPHSTPATTNAALGMLMNVGFTDFSHPLYQGALNYLQSGKDQQNGLWMFSVPENDHHPHAPWWTHSEEINRSENLGLSAQLAAFVLTVCPEDTQAQAVARQAYAQLAAGERSGENGLGGYAMLMPHWAQMGLDISAAAKQLMALGNAAIVRDPAQWMHYVPRPSSLIRTPDDPLYPGNEAAVETELDWLIDTLPEDDVWPLNWCWFDLQEAYADAFAVSRNWWKAWKVVEHLQFLKAFGRIE